MAISKALYAMLTLALFAYASYSYPTAKILVGTPAPAATASSTYWRLTASVAVGTSAAPDNLMGKKKVFSVAV